MNQCKSYLNNGRAQSTDEILGKYQQVQRSAKEISTMENYQDTFPRTKKLKINSICQIFHNKYIKKVFNHIKWQLHTVLQYQIKEHLPLWFHSIPVCSYGNELKSNILRQEVHHNHMLYSSEKNIQYFSSLFLEGK